MSKQCPLQIVSSFTQAGRTYYQLRCPQCHITLPSFDPPERTYYGPCSAATNDPIAAAIPEPSIVRRFLIALRKWLAAGCPVPSTEIRQKRRTACDLCPLQEFIDPRGAIERCGDCRCWLPAKRLFLTESCPAERWPGQKHEDGQGLVLIDGKLNKKTGCGCGA